MTAVRLDHLAPRLLTEIAESRLLAEIAESRLIAGIAESHDARCKRTCGVRLVRPLRILSVLLCQMSECQLVS